MEASRLIDELVASVRLAGGSGTVLLLVGKDERAVEEARLPVLASLRKGGPFQVEDLGKADAKLGPRAWVGETRNRTADAFALVVQPGHLIAVRAFGRRLNGEREHLRALPRPLLLFMSADDERALREVAPDFFTWIAQVYELPPPGELMAHARRSGAILEARASVVLPGLSSTAAAALTSPPVRFLHLSDVHFKTGSARAYDQDKVLRGLLERLRRDRKDAPIDLVFFTGDLANTAAESEYKSAVEFLSDLLAVTGVDPGRLFVVPGNHDVDRKIGRWTLRTLGSDEEAADFFVEAESRRLHEQKFLAYRRALSDLLGKERPLGLRVGADAVEVVEVRGAKIAVASFNSAWFAVADDDIEKLWLGEASVDHAARRIAHEEGVTAAVALLHHPTDYLSERERSAVENHLERSFDIVLRGHLHKDKAKSVHTGRGGYVELAAPAAYQGSRWPNGCFIGELHLSPRALRVRPYKFGSGADPWMPDPSVFPDDEDGSHTFALRERRGKGAAIRGALGGMARSILAEVGSATRMQILHASKLRVSGSGSVGIANESDDPALSNVTMEDLLSEMESGGGRFSRWLRERLVQRLLTQIPLPPQPPAPWGKDTFEAMLTRLVAFWSEHREAWIDALGHTESAYRLIASAFFRRQAGAPVDYEVLVGSTRADLVIGSDDKTAVVEIRGGDGAVVERALLQIDRVMDDLHASLGAVLWFRPDRPQEQQAVKVFADRGDRTIWLVTL